RVVYRSRGEGAHAIATRKKAAIPLPSGSFVKLEEGHRQAARGRQNRVLLKGIAMGIRFYKPTTPGRRGGSVSDFSEITDRKKKPEKSLLHPLQKKGGRNNQGIVTTRFRGGGAKRMY